MDKDGVSAELARWTGGGLAYVGDVFDEECVALGKLRIGSDLVWRLYSVTAVRDEGLAAS